MAEIYEGVKFQTHILTSSDIIQIDVKLSCHLQAALNFFIDLLFLRVWQIQKCLLMMKAIFRKLILHPTGCLNILLISQKHIHPSQFFWGPKSTATPTIAR